MSEEDQSEVVTERIFFTGRVQGVGFRFTTRGIAKRFPVTGFVRNLADGRVELVIRGSTTAINEVISRLAEHFRENLTRIDRDRIPSDEPFPTFEIRH